MNSSDKATIIQEITYVYCMPANEAKVGKFVKVRTEEGHAKHSELSQQIFFRWEMAAVQLFCLNPRLHRAHYTAVCGQL
jgi:hypothetical protein